MRHNSKTQDMIDIALAHRGFPQNVHKITKVGETIPRKSKQHGIKDTPTTKGSHPIYSSGKFTEPYLNSKCLMLLITVSDANGII